MELSLPSTRIEFRYNPTLQQEAIIDELKSLALKGHEVYSAILEKLLSISNDAEIPDLKLLLQKHQATFKAKIEEVQLKLTSPTFENRDKAIMDGIWKLEDAVVMVKRMIADACDVWNSRLNDLMTKTPPARHSRSISSQDMPLNKSNLSMPVEEIDVAIGGDEFITPDSNVIDVAGIDADSFLISDEEVGDKEGLSDEGMILILIPFPSCFYEYSW